MTSPTPPFIRLVLIAAILSNMGLAWRSIHVERKITNRLQSADSLVGALSADKKTAAYERAALIRSLGRMPLSQPFLSGIPSFDSTTRITYEPADGVYYLISPTCRACDINYPFLDSLARHTRLRVVAISRDASPSDLYRYVEDRKFTFPLLAAPAGYVEHITPQWATPLSVIVLGGKLHSIVAGRLDDNTQRDLFALEPQVTESNGRK